MDDKGRQRGRDGDMEGEEWKSKQMSFLLLDLTLSSPSVHPVLIKSTEMTIFFRSHATYLWLIPLSFPSSSPLPCRTWVMVE